MGITRKTNTAGVAAALLAVATIERGPVGQAVRCPGPAIASYALLFARYGNNAGMPRDGQAFDLCIPDMRDKSITPTKIVPHSGKNSQQTDKKQ